MRWYEQYLKKGALLSVILGLDPRTHQRFNQLDAFQQDGDTVHRTKSY
jgi:hypothetical protein